VWAIRQDHSMRTRLFGALLAFGLIIAAPFPARAQSLDAGLDPISSSAKHITIMDYATGQTVYCRDCRTPMPPASMSKLMTMLVVADQVRAGKVKWDTQVPISENAWRHGAQSDGSHMFLELNSRVSVQDLIKGVIIVSANDACIALAEGIAGHEAAFVDLMNKRAEQLGLKSARFRNATGLPDPAHVISSEDLAKLTAVIIREYPEIYRFYAERTFTFNNKTQENRNPLLAAFNGADGGKTGHTSVSGYGMVGSAMVNGQRRIIVFNGLPSMAARAQEARNLMNAAFFDFGVSELYKKDAIIGEADVWLGGRKSVPLTTAQPIIIAAHRSVRAQMKARIVYQGPVPAPIKQGDEVAKLVVEGGGVRYEFPLVAARKVGRANPFARAGFGLSHLFSGE
jgi:D-alanyl-D-alanine carboxypeptidase (penicillin-binding protein 5/6)